VLWAGTLYRSAKPMPMFEALSGAEEAPEVAFPAQTPARPQ
jgi:hypothetical protein